MNLSRKNGVRGRQQAGMATLVMIVLLGIVLAYVASNARTLDALGGDLRLIERHQTNWWSRASLAAPAKASPSGANGAAVPPASGHE